MLGNEAAAEKSVGQEGELFDLKQNTARFLRVSSTSDKLLILRFKSKGS
jgi:hypothetical protein